MQEIHKSLTQMFEVGLAINHFNKLCQREVGLSLVQWCLLQKLVDAPGLTARAFAKTVGIQPGSLTPSLKRLEKKKYLFIEIDSYDVRKKNIFITRKGRNILVQTTNEISNRLNIKKLPVNFSLLAFGKNKI